MKTTELSLKVKELRKEKQLSQEQLAGDSQLSLRTIQRVENGETEPHGDTLRRLARALDVTTEELITWSSIKSRSFIFGLNTSALSFLIFPLLGVLVPLSLWLGKKDKIRNVYKAGAELLNFQITWSVIYYLGFAILAIRITSASETQTEDLIFILIHFVVLSSYNLFRIGRNMVRANKGESINYGPKINFIRKEHRNNY